MLRIRGEVLLHVFVDFFLEVDSNHAVRTDNLISAYAGILGDISAGIRNANICWIVAHGVMRSFLSGGDQFF